MTLYSNWGCLALPSVVHRSIRLLGLKTSALKDLVKKYLILILQPGIIQKQKIKLGLHATWCVSSLESSGVPYVRSHVYLLNNSFHVIL